MSEVRKERTGWRDKDLSARHRRWGWDAPAIDLDLIFCEYDTGEPKALVEYKNEHAAKQYASHPSYQALISLGTNSKIPVFAVRYADDFSWWTVTSLNDFAKEYIADRETLSEADYVRLLYRTKGYEAPKEIIDGLNIEL